MSNRKAKLGTILSAAAILLANGCTSENVVQIMIGSVELSIPRENVVDASIFFLPNSQQAVHTILNPEEPLDRQIGLLIQTPSDATSSRQINLHREGDSVPGYDEEGWGNATNILRNGDDVFWTYDRKVDGSQMETIASCHAMGSPGQGTCIMIGVSHGLDYTASFNDLGVAQLRKVRDLVAQKLLAWRRAP